MGKGPVKQHNKKNAQPTTLGQRVMCIALGGAIYQCQNPRCYKVIKRGMLSEYEGKLYCGESCIKQAQRVTT